MVDDVMIEACFAVVLMTSSADPTSQYRGSKFYWILGYSIIRVVRVLDWHFSISGSKVMPKIPNISEICWVIFGDFLN